jgi:hypothetical protein
MDNEKLKANSNSDVPNSNKSSLIWTVVFLVVIIILLGVFLGPWLGLPWWMILIISLWLFLCGLGGVVLSRKLRKQMNK